VDNLMPQFVPPAGVALGLSPLAHAWKALISSNGDADETLASFAAWLGVRKVFGVSSGRAALTVILRSLHRLCPDRDVVALPAYTCFTVPASVVRAGLKLHPLEMNPETLDIDYEQLQNLPEKRLLCFITANLFGIVNDVPRLRRMVRSRGAFVIDDAAQSMGATRNGKPSGTMGDVGFYSLGRGKPLSAGEGGIIITNCEEIASAIHSEFAQLPKASRKHDSQLFLNLLAQSIFLRPSLYWIPNSLPFLKLGTTEFAPSFPLTRLSAIPCTLLPELRDRLLGLNERRRENAAHIIDALRGNSSFVVPTVPSECRPIYARFPLLAKSEAIRDRAVRELQKAGIGASPFYPSAVCDISGIAPFMDGPDFHRPRAETLSRTMLTLPTHPLVRRQDLDRMADVLRRV
jgi:perosamine synthetase